MINKQAIRLEDIDQCHALAEENGHDIFITFAKENYVERLLSLNFPLEYINDVTAALFVFSDGDTIAVFVSESGQPASVSSWWHPITFYVENPEDRVKDTLNPYYDL